MLALCKSSNWNTSKHWIARLNSSSSKWIYVYIDGRKGKLCKITALHTSISINRIPMHAKIEIFFIPFLILPKLYKIIERIRKVSVLLFDMIYNFIFWLLWFLFLYRYSSFARPMFPCFLSYMKFLVLTVNICLASIACDKRKLKLILFILFGHSTPGVLRQYANNRQKCEGIHSFTPLISWRASFLSIKILSIRRVFFSIRMER